MKLAPGHAPSAGWWCGLLLPCLWLAGCGSSASGPRLGQHVRTLLSEQFDVEADGFVTFAFAVDPLWQQPTLMGDVLTANARPIRVMVVSEAGFLAYMRGETLEPLFDSRPVRLVELDLPLGTGPWRLMFDNSSFDNPDTTLVEAQLELHYRIEE